MEETIQLNPLISIVSVVFNAADEIEKTIAGVIKIISSEIEYIIIDGGSTDGTVNVIKKYTDKISFWKSEHDKGIYDAMNKGIAKAKGKFICFINCGDILLTIPLNELRSCNADMACFPVKTSQGLRVPEIGFKFFLTNTLPHQGIFYKNNPGLLFDIQFKIFSDYALNLDFVKQNKKIALFTNPVVAEHSLKGLSHEKKRFVEFFDIIQMKSGIHYRLMSFMFFKWQGIKKRLGR